MSNPVSIHDKAIKDRSWERYNELLDSFRDAVAAAEKHSYAELISEYIAQKALATHILELIRQSEQQALDEITVPNDLSEPS